MLGLDTPFGPPTAQFPVDSKPQAPLKRVRFDVAPPPFPDEELGSIANYALREQLEAMCRVLKQKQVPLDSGAGRHILEFAISFARQVETTHRMLASTSSPHTQQSQFQAMEQLLNSGHVVIAKLLHLVHIDANASAQCLNPFDTNDSINRLHTAFDNHISTFTGIEKHLEQLEEQTKATDLQDASRVVESRLPMDLARLLLSCDGSINFGLIPAIEQWLSAHTGRYKSQSRHQNLYYGLQELFRDSELRGQIYALQAPQDQNTGGLRVIRTTLGLPPHLALNAQHARLTVLSASLSHLRQGRVGSCFATNLGIELMSSDLKRCVADWTALLKDGYVERTLDGTNYRIPFLPKLPKDFADSRITINSKAERTDEVEEASALFHAPGIQAALRELGVSKSKASDLLKRSVQNLTGNSDSCTVRIERIFKDVVDTAVRERVIPSSQAEATAERLVYGFDSMTQHPLLRAWENSLANMAEVELEGYVFKMVSSTCLKVCRDAVKHTLQDEERLDQILTSLIQALEARMRPLYDPSFSHASPGSDGRSVKGAFVLYDTQGEEHPRRWKRVDTPQRFQTMLQSVLEETQQRLESGILTRSHSKAITAVLTRLQKTVGEDAFIQTVLDRYPRGDNDVEAPHINYHRITHSPWVDKCGNFSSQVRKTYFELAKRSKLQDFRPYRAVHLLTHLIDTVRAAPQETQVELARNRFHLIPVGTSGQHAFSLTLGDPSFVRAWFNQHYARDWIDKELLRVGRETARTPVTPKMRRKFLKFCRNEIICDSDLQRFNKAVSEFPKGIWVSDLRDRTLNLLRGMRYQKKFQRDLDEKLLTLLPESQKQSLMNSAVRFADTNWHRETCDVSFAFMHNPFSDRLEIWELEDDGTFSAVDQDNWLLDRKWQISGSMLELFPAQPDNGPSSRQLRNWKTLIAAQIEDPDEPANC